MYMGKILRTWAYLHIVGGDFVTVSASSLAVSSAMSVSVLYRYNVTSCLSSALVDIFVGESSHGP